MKTSNKLLVAGFLAVVLLITAIHVGLYAKIKAGDFTIYHVADEMSADAMQPFPNILFVTVRNVRGATVRFSDATQVEKAENEDVQYVQKGDTLLITGKSGSQGGDFSYPVEFYLPPNANLSVFNSSLAFLPGKKGAVINPVIQLEKSALSFYGGPLALGHVKITAKDSSAVLFEGNTQVDHLDVQLSHSTLAYGEGNFGQLSIVTDSASRLSLQTKHLLKATIKTIAPQ